MSKILTTKKLEKKISKNYILVIHSEVIHKFRKKRKIPTINTSQREQ